ncbi:TMEM8A_3 [Blepharisma stoltei]|uniref:Post-GPI attachment to proteins factor 3 n=1 Tax=Blepharisma stoltei TaxID=1481888 RepID=A0AAU9K947_9CILI|nr:unnamed protein product [Blepharisma stoltei]
MLYLFLSLAFASELATYEETYAIGKCKKMQICYDSIEIIDMPLLHITIEIIFLDNDKVLYEYPDPTPYIYIRFDAVPDENYYDYKAPLYEGLQTLVSIPYPEKYKTAVFKIDGGLTGSFQRYPAYTVHGWGYQIKAVSYYYLSDSENTAIKNAAFLDGKAKSNTEILDVQNDDSDIFMHKNIEKYIQIKEDVSQDFIGGNFDQNKTSQNHGFLVSSKDCQYRYGFKMTIYNYDIDEEYIDSLLMSHIEISVSLQNSDSYLSIKNCKSSTLYCKIIKQSYGLSLLMEIGYLKSGYNIMAIKIDPSINSTLYYDLGIFKTEVGNNLCNGQKHAMFKEIAFSCKCGGNTAGANCEKLALNENTYMTGLYMLVYSNLAMVPAIITGILHWYYGEVAVYGTNMMASMVYHSCDWGYECFGMEPQTLRVADFTLSYMSIMAALIKVARFRNHNHKLALYCFIFALLLYIGLHNNFNGILFSIMPPLIAGLIPLSRWLYLIHKDSKEVYGSWWSWDQAYWFFWESGDFQWKWIFIAASTLFMALICKFSETNNSYWIVHSFWHIFIMLTPFAMFHVFSNRVRYFKVKS